ncbi:MAG: Clp protease ClpP [Gemmobacter sp.]|uniref:head maturation protease, ClpP-related n=1 Tax=Gemmobacter sp. TaxID=1898957 RepID=UPI001A5F3C51|nr:head maturation protease, ClpP-related [Gemmobacter sp.]MBL8560894.1 Clp protease ClpP [Gemmobacter sp.]
MKKRGTDLIIGGELVLSGYVISDEAAGWAWEEEIFFCPSMVREALLAMGEGRITIRLNSGGGDPVAGEAIRATLAGHPGGCTIIVEGQASSAASLILMGAADRQMTAGSFIMLHNPSAYVYGGADDMRAQADFLDMLARVYAQVYAERSGQSLEAVMQIMAAETFYNAEAAIEAGFIDQVAAESANSSPVKPFAELKIAMTRDLQTYVALMRDKAPERANGGAPRTPAPVAVTMETPMPTPNPSPAPVNPPVQTQDAAQAAVMAERQRVTMIQTMARPYVASGRLTDTDVQALIDDGTGAEMAGTRLMATMAQREPAPGTMRVTERGRDETETRRVAMEGSLVARLSRAQPEDVARQYMDHSIVDMAAERLGQRRVPGNFAAREEILRMAFHSISDFPALLENAMNRSLAARYAQAQPTYRRIARQRTYVDFRDHTTVRVGDFPNLQPVSAEGGELKSGTFGESKETTAVKAYGVQVLFSRQLLVNDSLDGIQQILNDRGAAVARFEEATFYAMLLSGANADGPTLRETTRQMFNTTDKTKAAAGAAITVTSLSEGRAALRKRQSLDKSDLDLSASILVCGPDKETEAQQILAPIQAQQAGNVNPFSGLLSPVVTAKIIGNAWYLFASPEEAACFEWGLLEGYTAPRFRMEDPFGVQGTKFSLEHDFGCGAIDFRGGWKNPGN